MLYGVRKMDNELWVVAQVGTAGLTIIIAILGVIWNSIKRLDERVDNHLVQAEKRFTRLEEKIERTVTRSRIGRNSSITGLNIEEMTRK